MGEGNGLSAGDILALTQNRNGMDNGFGGGYFWWVIIFFIIAGMFNGNGWGNNRNGLGEANLFSDEFIKRDIFNTNQNVSETAGRTQQEVLGSSCQTQRDVLNNKYDLGMQILENRYANQLGFERAIGSQKDCCCETKEKIMENRYENALGQANLQREILLGNANMQKDLLLGNKDLQAQLAQCCCDLQTAIHAEGEETRRQMQNDKIEELRASLNTATASYNNLSLANSIVNQVRPCPIPAYITCSPYDSRSCGSSNNYGYGFGYGLGVSSII